jgi:ABC-type multidrug transport system fused ATPase/permease subunit
MTGTRFIPALTLSAIFAASALAQQAVTPPTATAPAARISIDVDDSHQTREEFKRLLERYPPEVGRVLKLDPTLFGNAAYMEHYPALAAFVAQHPEVAHNPRFFLASVWVGDSSPESSAERVWRNTMEGLMIFVVMFTIIGVLTWLIRTVIAHRKWSRVSRIQADVHTKILDRFATSEELLAYVQSSAGKRFLESAPIPVDAEQQISPPVSRILWSVQVGVVLAMAGLGLFFVSNQVEKDLAPPLFTMSILGLSVGAGFVLSAIVSYAISRRLGLWQGPAGQQAQLAE